VPPTALADGMRFTVKFHVASGAAPTLNINLLGAKPLFKWYQGAWVAVGANDIALGQKLLLTYDQTSGNFQILQPLGTASQFNVGTGALNVVQLDANGNMPSVPGAAFTGERKNFLGTIAQIPTGWVPLRGTSIGDASSGATERANADTVNLFTLLWANTNLTLQNSSGSTVARGANAAADYAAHCRLVLPDYNNRFVRHTTSAAATATAALAGADTHSHNVSGSTSVNFGALGRGDQGFSINVASDGHTHNVSGTTDGQSNVPAYVTEIALVKL